jgi:hypothetical protein
MKPLFKFPLTSNIQKTHQNLLAKLAQKTFSKQTLPLYTVLLSTSIGFVSQLAFLPQRSLASPSPCAGVYSTNSGGTLGYLNNVTNSYTTLLNFSGTSTNINAAAVQPGTGKVYFVDRNSSKISYYDTNTNTTTTLATALPTSVANAAGGTALSLDITRLVGATFDNSATPKLYLFYGRDGILVEVDPSTGAIIGGGKKIGNLPLATSSGITSTNGDIGISTSGQLYLIGHPSGGTAKLHQLTVTSTTASVDTGVTINGLGTNLANGLAVNPVDGTVYISASNGTYSLNISGSAYTATLLSSNLATDLAACGSPEPDKPTISKQFNPTTAVGLPGTSTLTLTLGNSNLVPIYLTKPLVDTFPTGLVVANPNGLTGSCIGTTANPATAVTATAGTGSVTLANGFKIPAGGCTVAVNVTASIAGTYTNSIAAGALQTTTGANENGATSVLAVTLTVSGKVWDDGNGNGVIDTGEATTDTVNDSANDDLYAVLTDSAGKVLQVVPVADGTGAYSFSNVTPNTDVKVLLSTTQPTIGSTFSTSTLTNNWTSTTPAGSVLSFNTGTTNVTNQNIGIEQRPIAVGATAASPVLNPGGTTNVPVPSSLFTGSTDSDGTVTRYRITAFPSNATTLTITISGVRYTPATFPAAGLTLTAAQLSSIQVDPVDGAVTVEIPFVAIDNAGQESLNTALARLPLTVLTDYGDAPDGATGTGAGNYRTKSNDSGPSHTIVSGIKLGANIDADSGTLENTNADADDTDGTPNDEDGVKIGASSLQNQSLTKVANVTLGITTQGSGKLNAWIDWNSDGDFLDTGEQIATDVSPTSNAISLPITVPATATAGTTYARFRYSTQTGLASTGAASDGEVEDYRINIANRTISCPVGSTATGSGYATGGAAQYLTKNSIFWLDWSCDTNSQFIPGDTVTKTWTGPSGISITATVSNITKTLEPYNTGSYFGDKLDDLYNGVNPIGLANRNNGEDPSYKVSFSMTLNGVAIPSDIVTAEAESTDGPNEFASWTTDGDPWEPLEAAVSSSLKATFSNGGKTVYMNDNPDGGFGTLVALTENVSNITVNMNAGGKEAIAFGIMVPFDYGDAPSTYGAAAHYARRDASGGSKPTTPTNVNSLTMATLSYNSPYLGAIGPDPEKTNQSTANADGDKNNGDNDEDAFTSLPNVPTTGTYSLNNIPVNNTTGTIATLSAWVDFNKNGVFEASEFTSSTVNSGVTSTNLSWNVPAGTTAGSTYARFRFTTYTLSDNTATTNIDERSIGTTNNGEVEDYQLNIAASTPKLLLVKRITAINGNTTNNPNDNTVFFDRFVNGGTNTDDDNNANWPTPANTYLKGAINAGLAKPNDEVEYTIYFLNTENSSKNVKICDIVPDGQTLVPDAYNTAVPHPTEAGALPADTGIALGFSNTALPATPTVYLTNIQDTATGDRGRFYPAGDPNTPAMCKKFDSNGNVTATGTAANTSGAVVVEIVKGTNTIPAATGAGTPADSYGFIRFRAKVK